MEQNEETKVEQQTNKKSGNYLTGTIGAIIGAVIGSIPYIICGVIFNKIAAVFTLTIIAGAFYGYKWFKGKIDKKLPIIIIVISVILLILLNLFIEPALMLMRAGQVCTFNKIISAIQSQPIAFAMDIGISILFLIMTSIYIISNINKQIENDEEDIKFSAYNLTEEDRKKRKKQIIIVCVVVIIILIFALIVTIATIGSRTKSISDEYSQTIQNNKYDNEDEDTNTRSNSDSENVTIEGTDITLYENSKYTIYESKEALKENLGEDWANNCDFAVTSEELAVIIYGNIIQGEDLDNVANSHYASYEEQGLDLKSQVITAKIAKYDARVIKLQGSDGESQQVISVEDNKGNIADFICIGDTDENITEIIYELLGE